MANFRENTRYTSGRIARNRSDEQFLVLREPFALEEGEDDVFISITEDMVKRPDLIASKAYNNPDLWWIIYEFNGIRDPIFELQVGDVLRIPSLERINDALLNLESLTSGTV
jgi:hypothetical protein